jgi:hypothetical protein
LSVSVKFRGIKKRLVGERECADGDKQMLVKVILTDDTNLEHTQLDIRHVELYFQVTAIFGNCKKQLRLRLDSMMLCSFESQGISELFSHNTLEPGGHCGYSDRKKSCGDSNGVAVTGPRAPN